MSALRVRPIAGLVEHQPAGRIFQTSPEAKADESNARLTGRWVHPIRFYEEGLAVNGQGLLVIESVPCVRGLRVVEWVEQRSAFYGPLQEGQGPMGGCSGGPIS